MLRRLPLALRIKCKILAMASMLLSGVALRPPLSGSKLTQWCSPPNTLPSSLTESSSQISESSLLFLPGQEIEDGWIKAKRKEEGSPPTEQGWCRACEQKIAFLFWSPASSRFFDGSNMFSMFSMVVLIQARWVFGLASNVSDHSKILKILLILLSCGNNLFQ